MKTVVDTLGVSRSRQYERQGTEADSRSRHYRRSDDGRYLLLIRQIIDNRPQLRLSESNGKNQQVSGTSGASGS